jgi:hypothetical protein
VSEAGNTPAGPDGFHRAALRIIFPLGVLEQAICCTDADHAAKLIQNALGIESDDVLNYTFPKNWPEDREVRARTIGDWLQTEARYLA